MEEKKPPPEGIRDNIQTDPEVLRAGEEVRTHTSFLALISGGKVGPSAQNGSISMVPENRKVTSRRRAMWFSMM